MIASTIGKKFLELYNQQENKNYSAKDFFEKEYFSAFYNHSKYMQWVTNSPFVQMKKGQKPDLLTEVERQEKLCNLYEKVESGSPDASTAIGFPASEIKEYATTSGQVTSMQLSVSPDEVFCSWIGSGLGVGVAGGMSIFFDHPQILLNVYKGWKLYREFLNDRSYLKLRGNQINTWNGQWLAHVFSDDYYEEDPTINFHPFDTKKDGIIEVKTQSWVKILVGLSFHLPNETLVGYIYNLGQTNTTIGYIPFSLPKIRKPIQLYRKLFGDNKYLEDGRKVESLYGSAFSFQRACQQGVIGVKALEPKGLRGLIPGKKEAVMPNYKKADADKIITFNTYITWILAMLNNDELWETAGEAAESFMEYEAGASKARKDRANNVKQVLDASHRKVFIDSLTKLVKEAEVKKGFVELAQIVNKMPLDNFSYFVTLIRFRYAEKSNN